MTTPTTTTIDDPDDPRVAAYHDIRERDVVGRQGLFVAEGEVVLRVLLGQHSRFAAQSVLVAAKRLPALLSLLPLTGAPTVYVASQPVMDRIAGFPIHRGMLGIGRIGAPLTEDGLLKGLGPRALLVVALGIANHDNLGGIFRNAAAFGADGVLLDDAACNPLYRKAIRVSVGATLTVPFTQLAGANPLTLLTGHGFEVIALSPGGSRELGEVTQAGRVALVLGTEGPGLPAEILARTRTVRIAMAPGLDSLNVAVASGIALHWLASQRRV